MKKKFQIITIFLLALGVIFTLTSCKPVSNITIQAENLLDGVTSQKVAGKAADQIFIDAQLDLALKLFKASVNESIEEKKNVLISPLSILLALSMTANGADEQTKTEMEALLGGGITIEDLNEYLYAYVNSLPSSDQYKLKIANSIWYREMNGLYVKPTFLQTTVNYYNAELYKSPFNDTTLKDINKWVNKNTDGMIEKILDSISPDAMLYLINALVFNSKWEEKYTSNQISDDEFTNILNIRQAVEMMNSRELKYLSCPTAQGFIKPYKDNKYSFAALLPNMDVDIYDFINSLTTESLSNILNNVEDAMVYAAIPKFSYDYSITMNKMLTDMGMPTAFNPLSANFKNMAELVGNNLHIGTVLHKTFIEVDEEGTKAAAVTGIGLETSIGPLCHYVKLDRPFVYMILDNETNLPIFIGALTQIQE